MPRIPPAPVPAKPELLISGFEEMSDPVFRLFQELIHQGTGIWLASQKKAMLTGRLAKRLRQLGLPSYRAYLEVVESDEGELRELFDRVSTNETHFFREPRHFDFLERTVYPEWRAQAAAEKRSRRLRVWSAGCSTGEEPYSMAMSLRSAFPESSGWVLEILASDLSTRVLAQARAAVWPIAKSAEIPALLLKEFMLRGTGTEEGKMKAGFELRNLIQFERINLSQTPYPSVGTFDLILCRNVLIYFDPPGKDRVIRQLLEHLVPGGYLFIGHSETMGPAVVGPRPVIPTVYRLPPRR